MLRFVYAEGIYLAAGMASRQRRPRTILVGRVGANAPVFAFLVLRIRAAELGDRLVGCLLFGPATIAA
jgi:hypothetical protein